MLVVLLMPAAVVVMRGGGRNLPMSLDSFFSTSMLSDDGKGGSEHNISSIFATTC